MEQSRTQAAWSSLDTLLTAGALGSLSDGQLLDHFRSGRDAAGQEAFRILVERHGVMVLALCRSLVRDPHEAEDAFQATFLVLVRRADSIRQRETIGPWLYGVTRRVARRVQIRSARRRKREVAADIDLPAGGGSQAEAPGTDQAVHEEIRRLPESLRAPLILCCLEGQSYDLAARRLGLREPTLRGRLHRARKTLESRLRRRGILTPMAARLLEPGNLVLPPLPSSLIDSTTHFATRWLTLSGLLVGAGAVPESIAALAQGVIQSMLFQTVKVCGLAAILTVGVVGTLVVAQQSGTAVGPGAATQATSREDIRQDAAPPRTAADRQQAEAQRQEAENVRRTAKILEKLDAKIDLTLPNPTTLSDFLKAVKQATTYKNFTGIPIYIDDEGLRDASIKIDSHLSVYPGPALKFVLRDSLRPLHLSFMVGDGYLLISSREDINERRLEAIDKKIDRLLKAMERLEEVQASSPPVGRQP